MRHPGHNKRSAFLVGTRWFGVLGPCKLLINELTDRGYQVYVFGREDSHYHQFDMGKAVLVKLKVKRSYFSFFSDFTDIVKILYYAISKSPAFVHSFNPKPSLLCFFSLLLVRRPRFFIGVTGLGNTFIKAKRLEKPIRRVMKLALSRASFVFFQNDDDVRLFVNELGADPSKVLKFTSPGVDVERFRLRQSFETGSVIKVLLVARLLWQKGVGDFVASYKKLTELGLQHNYQFTLVGELDPEHPDRLSAEDAQHIVDQGIEWIPWTDSIETIYEQNDILLFMSQREGGPRAILEASATGMPTVGSNCIGVRELIVDGETGFTVDSGAIDDIVSRLEYYRLNPALIANHGSAARKLIAEQFSLENATRAQLEMYTAAGLDA